MKTERGYKFAGIIPARYASTRFPGKPLAIIGGRTVIQRVYEQASKSLEIVYVATDDDRIFASVKAFGGKPIMTSPDHKSGTDRCCEAINGIESETGTEIDIVINIQGDEPFIKPEQIDLLVKCFDDNSVTIATLIRKSENDKELTNPNHPKVIVDRFRNAIYFSRSVIPYLRDADNSNWLENNCYYKHLGLYAYKKAVLREITKLSPSSLELAESLEQNRWIENGYKIRTAVTDWESIGIDTPADLEKAKTLLHDFI